MADFSSSLSFTPPLTVFFDWSCVTTRAETGRNRSIETDTGLPHPPGCVVEAERPLSRANSRFRASIWGFIVAPFDGVRLVRAP